MRLSCKGRQRHSTSTAWQDASKKTGAAPASSDSVDGADKREMGIVKSKRARKGKERKGSFLPRLEECALSVFDAEGWC